MNTIVRNIQLKLLIAASIVISSWMAPMASLAVPVNFLPTSYLQKTDSPFIVGNGGQFITGGSNFFLDDFEDGLLNTTGVSETSGNVVSFLSGPPYTDSVDEDDGAVDGNGINGTSLLLNFHSALSEPSLVFSFDSVALGGLPTHAGLVVTGLNGNRTMEFRAFDSLNTLVSSFQFQVFVQPDGGVSEDRFVGISYTGGISRIELAHITNPGDQVEIDHLQYGLASAPVPEPSTMLLLGSGLVGLIGFNYRRKKKG